jgi:hypothetical protein
LGGERGEELGRRRRRRPVEFEDVRLIIEFNASDEDVGVQFFLDVDSWQSVRIFSPAGKGDLRRP